jgi:hypothetical protein
VTIPSSFHQFGFVKTVGASGKSGVNGMKPLSERIRFQSNIDYPIPPILAKGWAEQVELLEDQIEELRVDCGTSFFETLLYLISGFMLGLVWGMHHG